MSIAEKLTSVANNVPKVYMAGAADFGLKGSAEGELATLNNVHPIEHTVEVGLSSKNLFDNVIRETNCYYYGGEKWGDSSFDTYYVTVEGGKTYVRNCDRTEWGGIITFWDKDGNYISEVNIGGLTVGKFTAPTNAALAKLCYQKQYSDLQRQVEEGTTPTAYTPYIADFSGTKVTVSGKNLFNPFANEGSEALYTQEDGSMVASTINTTTGISVMSNSTLAEFAPSLRVGETYTLNANTTVEECKYIYLVNVGSVWVFGRPRTITEADLQSRLYFYTGAPQTTAVISNIQIEYGETATEYEPYISAEYTSDTDGTVEGVKSISPTMNISADKAGVTVSAECFLDPEAVVKELSTAIISLGGEI